MHTEHRLDRYLEQRSFASPWVISGLCKTGYLGVVVIPALAESDNISSTLESIAQIRSDILEKFLVLVVVNHREDADPKDKEDNLATLMMLPGFVEKWPMNLAWVDAASPGLELPLRNGGVGMARKVGFDLALKHLAWQKPWPILVSLDADTQVQPDYLSAIIGHFETATSGGAVIPFCHRISGTDEGQEIIDLYELFLRSYILGLSYAGSPYAFHTVGSAMACSGAAYLRCGGMNCRRAGEDFYFLQQLKKIAGIQQVKGTVVHPSPRASHRVPFGTGRSVAKALTGGKGAIAFYHPECFRILRDWLSLAADSVGQSGEMVFRSAEGISPLLSQFLDEEQFRVSWERISRMKRDKGPFLDAFHEWFDGLRTMKLIHHLSADVFPRCGPAEALPHLLELAGLERVINIREQLGLLRGVQSNC